MHVHFFCTLLIIDSLFCISKPYLYSEQLTFISILEYLENIQYTLKMV